MTRIEDNVLDAVQRAAVRMYAWRGESMARLLTPAGMADPYPVYEGQRAEGELLHSGRLDLYVATSHSLVSRLTRHPLMSADERRTEGYPGRALLDMPVQGHEMMLRMDDPDHARIRRLVGAAFSPRAIEAWRPMVERVSEGLLDDVDPGGFDVVGEYAVPLTVSVICELLGVPSEEWRAFRRWGSDATAAMGVGTSRSAMRRASAAWWSLADYLSRLIADRRKDPGSDLLSIMIEAEEAGDRLSDRELVANSILLLIAGFETTVNLIGNSVAALSQNPDEWGYLLRYPELAPNAVEEFLRFDSPVQFTSRIAKEDVELDGTVVPKGRQIALMIASANRDPEVFADPDRLDLRRKDANRHLAFSSGTHHCLGANLARLEASVALQSLTRRFSRMQVVGQPRRRANDVLRGYDALPVRVQPHHATAGV